ncbi:ABC transporter substrate-binding protein [Paenibacillus typhae]|uniref:DNA-binding transcriptional regulator SgrR of sgrS sRNA, contains a MarR-type HTH domain and a solute-binding domain n=1 Tax=Paenibacillus typhae TaxID=1174501 RepID=A0A1G8GZJ5_9BACL|nr:ABC transporter substrate-binding protein [Paenibacillus typhae]SDH99787.1 DNA-binding transcriptional regulator SgrR of sgrS sRNA, contains a MarR-type HTH domain and a solute-binding domain [Paenibacillus typhae]
MDNHIVHYLRISAGFNSLSRLQEPLPASIEGLGEVLCCTPRNVKFILRRLEEKALIHWRPGRGRGHFSAITFLRSEEDVMEELLLELVNNGKIKQGIELIGLPEVNSPLKERLLAVLNKQMGYHSEADSTTGLDVLRITSNRRMEELDSASVYTAFEAFLLGQIFSTLLTYEASTGSFTPGLAHMWETNRDYTSYIFYLRKGVRFHHGRVMTSRNVKDTLLRLKDKNSPAIWHFRDVAGIELLGDHRIRFDLSRPNRFFLHALSSVYMSVLPCDQEFNAARPSGTGPYRVINLSDDVLELAAFDDYYGIRPLLDRVEIWSLPDKWASVRQYQLPEAGEVRPSPALCTNNSIDYPATGCRYLLTNFRKNGLQHEPHFRKSMSMLYHPVALIKELGGNRLTPAASFLPWLSRRTDWTEPGMAQIREQLQLSRYNGEVITIAHTAKKEEREEAVWLQQRGAAAGIRLSLLEYKDFQLDEIIGRADFVFAEEVLEDDWQWGMINYFANRSNHLHRLLLEHQLTEILQAVDCFAELDEDSRSALLEQTESILRDQAWVLYGCHLNKRAQLNQSLFGLHTGSFGFLDISKLWIKSSFPESSGRL